MERRSRMHILNMHSCSDVYLEIVHVAVNQLLVLYLVDSPKRLCVYIYIYTHTHTHTHRRL
jgi:hypothetical protein